MSEQATYLNAKQDVADGGEELRKLRAMLDEVRATGGVLLSGWGRDADGFAHTKQEQYQLLVARVRTAVRECVPRDAIVLVLSKGDPQLLALGGRRAWHFPQTADGTYAGAYPPDSAAAIEQLEAVRARGAQFLVIPRTSAWWLDYYGDFRRHIDNAFTRVCEQDACLIFDLRSGEQQACNPVLTEIAGAVAAAAGNAALPDAPEDAVRMELAMALARRGRVVEARDILKRGLHKEPASGRLAMEMIQVEISAGELQTAQRLIEERLDAGLQDAELLYQHARVAWQQGQMDAVQRRLEVLLQRCPHEPRGCAEMLRLLCSRLEGEEAAAVESRIAQLRDFLAKHWDSGHLTLANRLRAVETLAARGAAGEALALLEKLGPRFDFEDPAGPEFVARLLGPVVGGVGAIPLNDRRILATFLTHAGNGFAAARDSYRTRACYLLAQPAQAPAAAASLNLGMIALAEGKIAHARQHFARVSRIYGDETCRVLWPMAGDRPWPHAPYQVAEAFEKLKPPEKSWPRITVITPSFNQVRYVEECLLSVINQQYPNLQYIVVDGNSTDGAAELIRRYAHQIHTMIIEPDRGQTHAINKGLARADGDMILWINSDDMLGPAALFAIALERIRTSADLIAGFCFEHSDRRFGTINLPAASATTFNLECLGDIFNYWMKGHFFYQPEVAFSRRILQAAGGQLEEKLYYTMDYEFWMRCAKAGAALSVVPWPVGMFRKHDQQKTANLDLTVVEQGSVRDRFIQPAPPAQRREQVRGRMRRVFAANRPRVHVVSTRAAKIFSPDTGRELNESLAADGVRALFYDNADSLPVEKNDLLIYLVHLYGEAASLRKLRDAGHDGPVIGWFWDNHHHVFENVKAAVDLDVALPGHAFAGHYLRSTRYLHARPVPLCVTQWTAREAAGFFEKVGCRDRTDDLYGGFVRYQFAEKRNRLIDSLIAQRMRGIYCLQESDLGRYFGLSLSDRFAQWASHKTSLCLPLGGDLSQRLFDALLTGQVPIVAPDIYDLDSVISPQLQASLPIVKLASYTPAAVSEARDSAIRQFDSQGNDGAVRRHRFALENHTFHARVRELVALAREF